MSAQHTPGPWLIATSNSWRRIVTVNRMESVCEPIKQNDGHPDLYFRNGGPDGPDARLIEAAPELLAALQLAVRQNGCDMLMTGEELRQCEAAIAKATGSAALKGASPSEGEKP